MQSTLCRPAAALCLLSLTTGMLGCSGGAGPAYESPQAVFSAAKTAVVNKDPLTFCHCITEESQQVVAGAMVMMGGMMKMMSGMASLGGPEAVAQAEKQFGPINAVLEKHGVTEDKLKQVTQSAQQAPNPESLKSVADLVSDKPMFIAEMIGAMENMSDGPSFAEKLGEEYSGELKDVKIDGDKAAGLLEGTSGTQSIEFRKTASGWRIHLDPDKLKAPSGPPTA